MARVVDLPVLYRVQGTPRRMRKSVLAYVAEVVPFEVEEMPDDGVPFSFGAIEGTIRDGRPWLPVRPSTREPGMAFHRASTRARAFVDGVANGKKPQDAGTGVSMLAGRPWRGLDARADVRIRIGADTTWTAAFADVETTDRAAAVEMSRKVASRLRIVDDMLVADRYEPLVQDGVAGNAFSTSHDLYDVVTGVVVAPVAMHYDPPLATSHPTRTLLPPRDAEWASGIDWEADVAALVAMAVAGRMRTVVNGSRSIDVADGIGHRAWSAIQSLVAWGDARQDARPAEMTSRELDGRLEKILRALRDADPMGIADTIDYVRRTMTEAQEQLSRALVAGEAREIDPEDVAALGMAMGR